MSLFKDIFLKKKSILILGFGREGRSTLRFLMRNYPASEIGIADKSTAIANEKLNLPLYLGKDYLKAIDDFDIVIKSPGVQLGNMARRVAKKITSQTDLFFQAYGRQTIGITGTKGKSTTASLIYHLLRNTGHKTLLMGNIGLPAFDFLNDIDDDHVVVYELSAHQLEYVHNSPHIAVLLNLFPEHLDYFSDFEEYKQAKLNIFRFQQQGDTAICDKKMPESLKNCEPISKIKNEYGNETDFLKLLSVTGLRGEHNLKNILFAFRVLQHFGLQSSQLSSALSGFHSLPHRLEYVGNFGGTDFYNDSISTVPQSTMAAVKSIPQTDVLILGGFDRGLDYEELVRFLAYTNIRHFFFLGKSGERMRKLFSLQKGTWELHTCHDLETVFLQMQKLPHVKCCMLSPAAASYDQFHNFEHRGDLFKKLAKEFRKTD